MTVKSIVDCDGISSRVELSAAAHRGVEVSYQYDNLYVHQSTCRATSSLGYDACAPMDLCKQREVDDASIIPCFFDSLVETIKSIEEQEGEDDWYAERDENLIAMQYDGHLLYHEANCLEDMLEQEPRSPSCHQSPVKLDRYLATKGSLRSVGNISHHTDDPSTSRGAPTVPLSTAQQNAECVERGEAPLQPNSWQGCKKSAWCNRENRHRGICNNRAVIPGLAAYGLCSGCHDGSRAAAASGTHAAPAPGQPTGGKSQPVSKMTSNHSRQEELASDYEVSESEPEIDFGETTEEDDDDEFHLPLGQEVDEDSMSVDEDDSHPVARHPHSRRHECDCTSHTTLEKDATDAHLDAANGADTHCSHPIPSPPLVTSSENTTECYEDASEGSAADGEEVGTAHNSDMDNDTTVCGAFNPGSPDVHHNEDSAVPDSPVTAKSGSSGQYAALSFATSETAGNQSGSGVAAGAAAYELPMKIQLQPKLVAASPGKVAPIMTPPVMGGTAAEAGAGQADDVKSEGKSEGKNEGKNTSGVAGKLKTLKLNAGKLVVKGMKVKKRAQTKTMVWQKPSGVQPAKKCTQCGRETTPVWRAGPSGPKTLCNACGVRYMKLAKRPR